jgi:hyaluronoglucosaminidase
MDQFGIGVIEGFWGEPWDWESRYNYASFLRQYNYGYYIYAPKADRYLRKDWQQDWPSEDWEALIRLGDTYHQQGLVWGIGFSPFEIHLNYTEAEIARLEQKIKYFNQLQLDILAILFDDMRGDCQEISDRQVDITHRIRDLSNAQTVIMCPTYYTDDPILDQLFGQRPADYLETLGQKLAPEIQVFWTGPKVCSTVYPEAHLQAVSQKLGRKPFIWDNYPVNDGARMSRFLHLRAFTNRPYQMSDLVAGHAVNPMNQAHLSQIPLATLSLSYQQKDRYDPEAALAEVVQNLGDQNLANLLLQDISLFQDQGLDQISPEVKQALIEKYQVLRSPYSQEIVRWLNEEYQFSPECLTG